MFRSLTLCILFLSAATNAAENTTRSVTVTGSGTATAQPDSARVSMAINARARDVASGQAAASRIVAAVLELTDDLNIDRDHVDTTGATVHPNYRWNNNTEEQELRGYTVGRQIAIRVTELDQLGRLIEGAVQAGVNQVSPPQLMSSARKDAERQALAAAAEDARANAEALASALDANLGKVMQISTSGGRRPPIAVARMEAQVADAAETYNAADLSFNSTVNVTFELVD